MINYTSKVSKATSKSDTSTRVIIPQGIKKLLGINPGDTIEWIVSIENSDVKVQVRKYNETKEWVKIFSKIIYNIVSKNKIGYYKKI